LMALRLYVLRTVFSISLSTIATTTVFVWQELTLEFFYHSANPSR
jgi:hypothetical protein